MVYFVVAVSFLALAQLPAVLAHARITSPAIRSPGNAFKQACGQTSFNSVSQDPTGHIEEQEPVTAGCELTLCRGMLFADQPSSNVLTVKPSQAMQMGVECTVPHGGPANVSLVDTTVGGSGAIIGSFLKTFDNFCPTTGPTPADQSNLQFTLPDASTIGDKCQSPGQVSVVSLGWSTPDFSQNYAYCVDVVMAAAQLATSTTPVVVPTTPVVAQTPATSSSAAKMLTSVVSVVSSAPTGIAAAANTNGTTVNGPSANAGRRRARILWF